MTTTTHRLTKLAPLAAFRSPLSPWERGQWVRVLALASIFFILHFSFFIGRAAAQIIFPAGTDSAIEFAADSSLTAIFPDGTRWGDANEPGFMLRTKSGDVPSLSVSQPAPNRLRVAFKNKATAVFRVTPGEGFVLFQLEKLSNPANANAAADIVDFEMGRIALPPGLRVDDTLGRALDEYGKHFVALSTAALQVRPANYRTPTTSSNRAGTILRAEAAARFGLDGSAFGILLGSGANAAAASERFIEIMPRFELAAGLPSPRFDGVWNKLSPDVRRSYLFLTAFNASQVDDALAFARRGGFDRILIVQSSWTRAPGHYEVNTNNFPGGLPQLAATVKRFQDAGFKTGFHFLAASIYPPDAYLTPIPENRLVHGVQTQLAEPISATATFLPTTDSPGAFPKEDGGYRGDGTVLRIGDELIAYDKLKTDAPFGFEGCRRGHLGTKPAAHPAAATVRHLTRAYGYHRIDLDTDLLPEIATHFAKIADACNLDMMYFDGAEWLQGGHVDHWYYNAKLIKAFYDAVSNKNMMMQASNYSPYSWHLLARTASADGRDDLKSYLDERSPNFARLAAKHMPLDIGWYYAHDANATIDMYEYILLATLAYDSSMSLQTSIAGALKHPFIGEILDKIHRFEELRLSGRITPELREKIKIDTRLAGKKMDVIASSFTHLRKEYRLLGERGHERFQRVVHTPWQKITPTTDTSNTSHTSHTSTATVQTDAAGAVIIESAATTSATTSSTTWSIEIPENLGPVRVGLNVHLLPEAGEQKLTDPFIEIDGKRIALKATLSSGQYLFQWPGEPTRLYAPSKDVTQLPESAGELNELPPGRYQVRFGAAGVTKLPPCRVRLTLQPPETIPIP